MYLVTGGDLVIGTLTGENILEKPALYRNVSGILPAPGRIQGNTVQLTPMSMPILVELGLPRIIIENAIGYWDASPEDELVNIYLTFIKERSLSAGVSRN